VLGFILVAAGLRETRPPAERTGSSLASAMAGYKLLMRDRQFLALTFIGAFGISSFFTYLANSSFVLIDHYGVSPTAYSLFFSVNAVAFIGSAQLTGRLTQRYGLSQVVRGAASAHALTMLALALAWLLGAASLPLLACVLFVGFGFLGLVVPSTSVLAMDAHGAIAGTAAALFGTLQMTLGGVVIAALGSVADGTPWPMVAGIALCSVTTCSLAWWTLAQPPRAEPVALPGA
jgi:MFS transporter, DHA1 family, multidrug resistance protein